MDNIRAVIRHKRKHAVFPLVCADHCTWLLGKKFPDVAHSAELLAAVLEHGLHRYEYDAVMLFVDAYVEAQALGCPIRFDPYPSLEGPRTKKHVDRTGIVIDAARILRQHVSVPVFVSVKGPFSLASFLAGVENFLKMVLTDRKGALALIDEALEHQVTYVRRLLKTGAHIFIGDPVASSSVVSPDVFLDFALGPVKVLCRHIKHCGSISGIHICGDTNPIITMLDEIDADILSVEDITPPTMTVKMGGVSTGSIIDRDHERIRQEVITALAQPHLILSTSCDVPIETDPASIKKMTTMYHEYNADRTMRTGLHDRR